MKVSHIFTLLAGAAVLLPLPATAAAILFQGVGLFNGMAPTTAISAPNESFMFSFDLPSPYTKSGTFQGGPTTSQATNFSYLLNGTSINATLPLVAFYSSAAEGGIDLGIHTGAANSPLQYLSIFASNGADLGSSGTITSPSFSIYSVSVGTSLTGEGSVALTTSNMAVSAVPLPPALPMFGAALLGLASFGVWQRRKRHGINEVLAA